MTHLEIVQYVVKNNAVAITGSMMLKLRGIDMGREPGDLDFINFEGASESIHRLKVPEGFHYKSQEGGGSSVDSVTFFSEELGIKLDFLYSEEDIDFNVDIPMGDLQECIQAKIRYAQNDKSEESKTKHLVDLILLFSHMSEQSLSSYNKMLADIFKGSPDNK